MNNPMLGALNTSKLAGLSNKLAPIRNMMQAVKAASNPSAAIQQLAQNNPQVQQAMQLVQESGGNPQKAFYSLAEKLGVDGDAVLKMLG